MWCAQKRRADMNLLEILRIVLLAEALTEQPRVDRPAKRATGMFSDTWTTLREIQIWRMPCQTESHQVPENPH